MVLAAGRVDPLRAMIENPPQVPKQRAGRIAENHSRFPDLLQESAEKFRYTARVLSWGAGSAPSLTWISTYC